MKNHFTDETFFINEAFNKAINDYINSKEKTEGILYNSFLVVVIRLLVTIYGELDIVNPFYIKNEDSFDINLMKYGAKREKIVKLKMLLEFFYEFDNNNLQAQKREYNPYFIEVQKSIIDLFYIKKTNFGLRENESKEFFELLYTPGTSNALRLSYNFLNAEDAYEVAKYYKMVMEENKEDNSDNTEKKNLLGFDIYKMFNVSIADLSKMNKNEIDNLNSEIYKSFDISEKTINKDYLLEEKIREIKMQNSPITTGNGYVDILLIMSVIITVLMVVVIFSTLVF